MRMHREIKRGNGMPAAAGDVRCRLLPAEHAAGTAALTAALLSIGAFLEQCIK